ncbi:MAG: ShlB/FhaC/HecB family hemolysin secretion/activation protein, partial [bacterium]
ILGLGYDNQGSEDTGRDNYTVEARFEDVLGLFEQWRFMQGTTARPFSKKRYSQTSLVSLSIPYRRWRASFWGAFEKNAVPHEGLKGYRKTEISQLGADLRYALSRTWISGTYLGGTIEHYTKQFSTADGILVMPFSGDITKCVLWASHFRYALGGVAYGKLSYSQGVHASDAGMGHHFNKNFKKLNVDGSFMRNFGNRWTWMLSGKAQIGEAHLFAHEKFSLGGMSTVRGFVDTQYRADSGYFLRNELEYLLFNRYSTKFFVGYDYGHLNPSRRDDPLREKSLQSICCGVRLNVKDINFEMLMARPIHTITSNRYTFLFGVKGEF